MIHALPGLGADQRMFPAPWKTLPGFAAHNWPPYRGERSLTEVALNICQIHGISDGDAIVGASLGGMVACEIAKVRNIRSLYLVGSAMSHTEVSPFLAKIYPSIKFMPFGLVQAVARRIPSNLPQMFSEVDRDFIRAMPAAIFDWEGYQGLSAASVFRLHGKHDKIIRPPRPADLLLDGGHFISMTHAAECVKFILLHEKDRMGQVDY